MQATTASFTCRCFRVRLIWLAATLRWCKFYAWISRACGFVIADAAYSRLLLCLITSAIEYNAYIAEYCWLWDAYGNWSQ